MEILLKVRELESLGNVFLKRISWKGLVKKMTLEWDLNGFRRAHKNLGVGTGSSRLKRINQRKGLEACPGPECLRLEIEPGWRSGETSRTCSGEMGMGQ